MLGARTPPERRVRAVREFHDAAGRMIRVGDLADTNDEFVRANPELLPRRRLTETAGQRRMGLDDQRTGIARLQLGAVAGLQRAGGAQSRGTSIISGDPPGHGLQAQRLSLPPVPKGNTGPAVT